MDIGSEHHFPIFISSTDYDLKDLRAELARFLKELGYRPILSSAEGFPDGSPDLQPWESCLAALDKCFVVLLIIDGKYGTTLDWPSYSSIFENRKVSPTHGEFIYAHKTKRRMLVFVRKEMMTHYRSYRQALVSCEGDREKAKESLAKTLPNHASFESLEFIHEVKTTRPILWIKEFEDVTEIKKEVHKKMINELAEIYMIKDKNLNLVLEALNKCLASLSDDEKKKALEKIGAAKQLIKNEETIKELTKKLELTQSKYEKATDSNSKEKGSYEKEIKALRARINELQLLGGGLVFEEGKFKLNSPVDLGGYMTGSSSPYDLSGFNSGLEIYNSNSYEVGGVGLGGLTPKCDECKNRVSHFSRKLCTNCLKYLCSSCWPDSTIKTERGLGQVCPECTKNKS